jgi:DNA-binding LacI/PurR family transcriptional regulator
MTIGIITNDQTRVFQRTVIAGVRDEAETRGYTVVVDSYAEDPDHPAPITLDYRATAGVIVIANAAPPDLLRTIFESGIPLSLVSHRDPDLPIPAVIADNTQGIAELVRHVVEDCQRRELVYIGGLPGQLDGDERAAAFAREVLRYNLTVTHSLRGDFDPDIAAGSLRDLIASGATFDAVIAADYLMGIAAVDTLRAAGLRVPEDVCVVGFGDAPEAEATGLTTVAANVAEQGRRAARQLITQSEGYRMSGTTVLAVQLVIRETCCRP